MAQEKYGTVDTDHKRRTTRAVTWLLLGTLTLASVGIGASYPMLWWALARWQTQDTTTLQQAGGLLGGGAVPVAPGVDRAPGEWPRLGW